MIRTAGSLKLGKVQASVLVRSLLKSERPSGLTQAIIEVGRINKTLYLLNYIDDEDYRRRILTQLNRGESRHAVARAICHGQKGEIRKRYTDGQEDQLGALGLVTNAVVLWNTIYMQAALDHLRAQGETLNDEDIARLSPLCHGHINMLGHYSFTLAELVTKGHLRPLKEAPGLQTFSSQEPLQHPTSGKGVVEMQFVNPAHKGQIAVRHRTRQIVDAATAEAEKLRLAHDG